MYLRMFKKAGQTKRFTITDASSLGWEVREEQDSQVVWSIRYTDWHRVERGREPGERRMERVLIYSTKR